MTSSNKIKIQIHLYLNIQKNLFNNLLMVYGGLSGGTCHHWALIRRMSKELLKWVNRTWHKLVNSSKFLLVRSLPIIRGVIRERFLEACHLHGVYFNICFIQRPKSLWLSNRDNSEMYNLSVCLQIRKQGIAGSLNHAHFNYICILFTIGSMFILSLSLRGNLS